MDGGDDSALLSAFVQGYERPAAADEGVVGYRVGEVVDVLAEVKPLIVLLAFISWHYRIQSSMYEGFEKVFTWRHLKIPDNKE